MIEYRIRIFILTGYGLVTFVTLCFNFLILPKLLPKIYSEEKWTTLKEILTILWCFFSIGIINFIYTNLLGFNNLSLTTFLTFQMYTLSVGIFPLSVIVILQQNRILKQHLKGAREINKKIQLSLNSPEINSMSPKTKTIILTSESGKEKLKIDLNDLLFIQSVENYIEIVYYHDSNIQKNLLRSTLKRIEKQFKNYKFIYKCHRSYLVNINKIEIIKGNSMGYQIYYPKISQGIPVARSYTKSFKTHLL